MKYVLIVLAFLFASPVHAEVKCSLNSEWTEVESHMPVLTEAATSRFLVLYDIIIHGNTPSGAVVYAFDDPAHDASYFIVRTGVTACAFVATGSSRAALVSAINGGRSM